VAASAKDEQSFFFACKKLLPHIVKLSVVVWSTYATSSEQRRDERCDADSDIDIDVDLDTFLSWLFSKVNDPAERKRWRVSAARLFGNYKQMTQATNLKW